LATKQEFWVVLAGLVLTREQDLGTATDGQCDDCVIHRCRRLSTIRSDTDMDWIFVEFSKNFRFMAYSGAERSKHTQVYKNRRTGLI